MPDLFELEDFAESYKNVKNKLVSADEINDYNSNCMAFVNRDKLGSESVHNDDEHKIVYKL